MGQVEVKSCPPQGRVRNTSGHLPAFGFQIRMDRNRHGRNWRKGLLLGRRGRRCARAVEGSLQTRVQVEQQTSGSAALPYSQGPGRGEAVVEQRRGAGVRQRSGALRRGRCSEDLFHLERVPLFVLGQRLGVVVGVSCSRLRRR